FSNWRQIFPNSRQEETDSRRRSRNCGKGKEFRGRRNPFPRAAGNFRFVIGKSLKLFGVVCLSGLESVQSYGVGVRRDVVGEENRKSVNRAHGRIRDGDAGLIASAIAITTDI